MQLTSPMAAAARKHTRKTSKNHKFFTFFTSCFGISSKVTDDHADGRAAPVNDHRSPLSSEIIPSTTDIHEVEAQDKTVHQVLSTPASPVVINKSEKLDESGETIASPVIKQRIIDEDSWSKHTKKLSHSLSMPLPLHKKKKEKEKEVPVATGAIKGKNGNQLIIAGEMDSVVGALILTITLIVMLVWGKACAILCTAAWFYFLPRFRANMDRSYASRLKYGGDGIDFDSSEYKKRVVLQGLLHRNQHS